MGLYKFKKNKDYKNINELPGIPDCVYIAVSRDQTVEVIKDFKSIGTGGAVCLASRFSETNSKEGVNKTKQLIENSETEKNQLRVTVENGAEKIPDLLKNLSKNKLEAVSVTANKPSLDDVFLEVTGYRLEGATEEEGLKEEVSENE